MGAIYIASDEQKWLIHFSNVLPIYYCMGQPFVLAKVQDSEVTVPFLVPLEGCHPIVEFQY